MLQVFLYNILYFPFFLFVFLQVLFSYGIGFIYIFFGLLVHGSLYSAFTFCYQVSLRTALSFAEKNAASLNGPITDTVRLDKRITYIEPNNDIKIYTGRNI